MELLLVRHGQTNENKAGLWYGQLEGYLSPEGKEQVKKLARKLSREKIDIAYCSDLKRARDTLKPLLDIRDLPVVYVPDLRERHMGVLEGKTTPELREYMRRNNVNFSNTNFETGESEDDIKTRLRLFYNKLLKEHKDESVLLVTHGGVVAHYIGLLFDSFHKKFEDFIPGNASLTRILVEDENNPVLLAFNELPFPPDYYKDDPY